MKKRLLALGLLLTTGAQASNYVTGTVTDIIYRSTATDYAVYFKLDTKLAQLAPCMSVAANDIYWHVDMDTPVAPHLLKVIEKSRAKGKFVAIYGMDDICATGEAKDSDTVFEVSPNWAPKKGWPMN